MVDAGLSAAERYCLRQFFLWKVYAAFEQRGLGTLVAETIARYGLDVIEETPLSGLPTEASGLRLGHFPEDVLKHIKAVHDYYSAQVPADLPETTSAAPIAVLRLPTTSEGYLCTVVLPAEMNISLARTMWRQFLQENTAVRLIVVGRSAAAQAAVDIADPIFFAPGGAQKPGRCLWAQTASLTPDICRWLEQQGYPQPAQALCIVLRANGTLSTVFKQSDVIDEFALSEAFFNAC